MASVATRLTSCPCLSPVPCDSACLLSRSQPTRPTERQQSKRGLIDVDGVRRRNLERFLEPATLQHQVVFSFCLLRKRMPNQLVVTGLLVSQAKVAQKTPCPPLGKPNVAIHGGQGLVHEKLVHPAPMQSCDDASTTSDNLVTWNGLSNGCRPSLQDSGTEVCFHLRGASCFVLKQWTRAPHTENAPCSTVCAHG